MKTTLSFKVPQIKPRNAVAMAMLERNGEFKPREFRSPKIFKRKPKNMKQAMRDWE